MVYMMKKTIAIWILISLLLLTLIILPTSKSATIGEHEPASGTTIAKILNFDSSNKTFELFISTTCNPGYAHLISHGESDWQTFTPCNGFYILSKVYLCLKYDGVGDTTRTIKVEIRSSPTVSLTNITKTVQLSSSFLFREFDFPDISVEPGREYYVWVTNMDLCGFYWCADWSDTGGYGGWTYMASIGSNYDFSIKLYGVQSENITVTRTAGTSAETNTISDSTTYYYTSSDNGVKIRIPVSSEVKAIVRVFNTTSNNNLTEVSSLSQVTENKYWFDSTNHFVYIGVGNISSGRTLTYQVNCSYGANFYISFPSYREVGQDIRLQGLITNATDTPISGVVAKAYLTYQNGTVVNGTICRRNCTGGNFDATIYTTMIPPGVYNIIVEYTDTTTGVTFKKGSTLYLSYTPASDVHVVANLHFSFYNNRTGEGLQSELFKIYVSDDTTIEESDRIFRTTYRTYTGDTLYYCIKDYFDNIVYPSTENYTSVSITDVEQFVDIPIDWYSFSVKNMNHSIVLFKMTNGSRSYEQFLFPYEPFYWNVIPGEYTINLTYYDSAYNTPDPSHILGYYETNITVDDNTYYWILGYDLRDIIIEITATNTTLSDLIVNVQVDIDTVNSTINNITTNILSSLNLTESNLTALNNYINSTITIINSMVDYLNNTIWLNLTRINTTINYINDTVWTNFTLINKTINNSAINIIVKLNLTEQNLSSLNLNVWADLNLTNAVVNYLNNTMWSNFTILNATITDINNKLSIDFDMLNITVDYINNTIWSEFNVVNSNIDSMETSIKTSIDLTETNLTTLNNYIWNAINITDSVVDYINNTIWNKIQLINITVDYINNTVWNNFTAIETDIGTMNVSIRNRLDILESNLTTLNNYINNTINLIDSVVSYINNTIWNDITAINTTISFLNNTIWSNFTLIQSEIGNVNISIHSSLSLFESNLTTLNNAIWNSINITKSVVDHLNNTIWNNLTIIESMIDTINNTITINFDILNSTVSYINNTIWNQLNFTNSSIGNVSTLVLNFWNSCNSSFNSLKNRSVVILSFYNTNIGLGIPDETLKIYLNGTRFKETIFYINNGTTFNLTIKDYYNTTLYNGTFTVNAPYMFLDLGLTFHSYKFNNKNEKYYMISFLKQNATRWYERAVCPYETIEFLLPSANYTLRIYDADYNEIYNQTVTVNRSMVYVIEGTNLSEIIAGQSVIRGQLLELRSELQQATMPSVRKIGVDLPYVYLTYDNVYETPCFDAVYCCPALVITATSENITTGTSIISHPLVPSADNENGTVLILDDVIYLEGNTSTAVNITYTDNGTVFSNTSYKPSYFLVNGENYTINATSPITVKRVTTYQQYKKFYWLYHTYTGLYEVTLNISNPLNTTIRKVVVAIQIDNQTTPQTHSFRVYDVTNSQWLEEGTNFEFTGSFIKFWLPQLTAHQSRQFRVEYYSVSEDITQEGIPIKVINTYTTKTYNNKPYYYFKAEWINPNSVSFRGTLYLKLNFTTPYPIALDSWIIFDRDNNRQLSSDEFVATDNTLIISEDAVGTVSPGGSRVFDCYFYLTKPTVSEEEEKNWFLTPQVNILGLDINGITLIMLIVFIGTIALAFYDRNQSHWMVFSLLLLLLTLYFTNI